MALQLLRYGALALVSVCLVMIALVVSGLVPLETVRTAMAKVPALVQVTPEKRVELAKADDPTAVESKVEPEAAKPVDDGTDSSAKPDANTVTMPKGDDTSVTGEDTQPKQVDEADVKDDQAPAQETETASEETPVPAFDVLRVEKDGSMVIAGRAAPNSTVTLRSGDGTIIGTGKAGPSGDFVIIPDNPLPAGDHSLNLALTGEDGSEIVSTETATVSVPEEQGGDVLAMISKEGGASRIVAKPETLQAEDTQNGENDGKTEVATAAEENAESDKPSEATQDESKNDTENAANTGQDDTKAADSSPATKADANNGEIAENAPSNTDGENEQQEQETAALDPQSDEGEQVAVEQKPTEEAAQDENKGTTPVETTPPAMVRVEAVEIERDQVFVAGAATQGSTVRIYIDNKPIGETRGTADNRFLVTRRFTLEPGRHIVRADSIDNTTGKVVARAEVPLVHEPVEDVAAAGDEAKDNTTETQSTETDAAKPDQEETDVALVKPNEPAKAAVKPAPVITAGSQPEGDAAATDTDAIEAKPEETAPATDDKTTAVAETDESVNEKTDENAGNIIAAKPEDEEPAASGNDTSETKVETEGESSQEVKPENTGDSKTTDDKAEPEVASEDVVTKDAVDTTQEAPAEDLKPAETEVAAAPKAEPENVDASEPQETTAAKPAEEVGGAPDGTIRTGTAIIIKRGDSLWRISRRTYGRGIRYTTIYEANKDQIRDPHWIYIGQIFKIPDRPDEELVEADG